MYVGEQINSYGRSGHEIQNRTTKRNPQHLENVTKTTNAEHCTAMHKECTTRKYIVEKQKGFKTKKEMLL